MALQLLPANLMRRLMPVFLVGSVALNLVHAQVQDQPNQPVSPGCRIEARDYKGRHAEQTSNRWVQLILIPQNGGRLIQLSFAGHSYLFVNPKFAGKHLPPTSSKWFNYGGDKLWLLPEGNNDEQHWAGNSDVLDDGPFSFQKISNVNSFPKIPRPPHERNQKPVEIASSARRAQAAEGPRSQK